MTAAPLTDLSRCAIHTFSTKPWSLAEACAAYAAAGVPAITVWRQHLPDGDAARAAQMVRDHGLKVPALCRGGFFPAADAAGRTRALDDNRRALDEAATLGADMVVLVCGALPGLPLAAARAQVRDGIAALLPQAEALGLRLAIEPLHPMYAGDKSCITSLAQARQIWSELRHPLVGVAVDCYHVWFDDQLAEELALAGAESRIFGFHICDWKLDTRDLLLDRGLPGEGCIDIRGIRSLVESAGFTGFVEVEIFSSLHWAKEQRLFLDEILCSYQEHG